MKKFAATAALASLFALIISAVYAIPSRGAGGNYLYWGTTPVKNASLNVCYDFANDSMRHQNFSNIRRSGSEVTGSRGGAYAAITCIGTAPRATAVVMVVGGDANETARARDDLRSQVARMIRFD